MSAHFIIVSAWLVSEIFRLQTDVVSLGCKNTHSLGCNDVLAQLYERMLLIAEASFSFVAVHFCLPWGLPWAGTMDEAGAGPFGHLHMFMMLKHFKTGRCGVVIGWGDRNGVPYLHLYFADREPADKNADRSKCYEWRRLSVFVPLNEPLMEHASEGGEQGAATTSSTNPEGPRTTEVVLPKATADDENNSLADDDFSMKATADDENSSLADDDFSMKATSDDTNNSKADDDFIMVDETPKERMKNEKMKNGELYTILEANGE